MNENSLLLQKVSIPTGSIKIENETTYQGAYERVSIPTGSIKIVLAAVSQALWILFQFQLVRLKSITADKTDIIIKFQFQLVRLKFDARARIVRTHEFQFQLVRLK